MNAEEFAKRRRAETLDGLLEKYATFHRKVENTPCFVDDLPHPHERVLHASIGLSTEAAELLDVYKKHLFGKQKPITEAEVNNLREECGDVFFYLWLALDALGYGFEDMLCDNINKLAARYNVTALKEEDDSHAR